MSDSRTGLVAGKVNRDRILKVLVLLMVGATLGAGAGGTLMAHVASSIAEDEAGERAYVARCLFRVAERHIGHERLIVEWRAEIRAMQPPLKHATAEAQR